MSAHVDDVAEGAPSSGFSPTGGTGRVAIDEGGDVTVWAAGST